MLPCRPPYNSTRGKLSDTVTHLFPLPLSLCSHLYTMRPNRPNLRIVIPTTNQVLPTVLLSPDLRPDPNTTIPFVPGSKVTVPKLFVNQTASSTRRNSDEDALLVHKVAPRISTTTTSGGARCSSPHPYAVARPTPRVRRPVAERVRDQTRTMTFLLVAVGATCLLAVALLAALTFLPSGRLPSPLYALCVTGVLVATLGTVALAIWWRLRRARTRNASRWLGDDTDEHLDYALVASGPGLPTTAFKDDIESDV
ncbi:hypothetical protein MKEN_01382200 [Mycena kentingensis (nom. inval.)]|nr:hypothetical protein MKEN_01382200 [Mycena kentingensis (nom. inval.)]